jgi:hypothetical protein
LFRPSALAILAASLVLVTGTDLRAQAAKKAPFAAESAQPGSNTPPPQQGKAAEKRGWQAAPLTCNAQPSCTSHPSARCVAVQYNYKDGTDKGRALEETIRRCERANRQDSACGCVALCRQAARCS